MQSAEFRDRDDTTDTLNGASERRVLRQAEIGAIAVVVLDI